MNLTKAGIIKNKCLTGRGNPVYVAFRISTRDEITVAIDRHRDDMRFVGVVERGALSIRRNAIDHAFITGSNQQSSLLVKDKRPDVLRLRIEKLFCDAVFNLVDL